MTYDETLVVATKTLDPTKVKEILEDATETLKRDCKRCFGLGQCRNIRLLNLFRCPTCGGTGNIKTKKLHKSHARLALMRAIKEAKVNS